MQIRHRFIATAATVLALAPVIGAAPQPPEQLLPGSARAVLIAPNAAAALQAWRRTQYSSLVNDPQLKPFLEDLTRQIGQVNAFVGLLAATWDELAALSTDGPAAIALVPAGGRSATVALMDTTGRAGKRNAFLRKIAQYAVTNKGQFKLEKIGAEPVTALALPANGGTTLYLHFKGDLLIIADDAAA